MMNFTTIDEFMAKVEQKRTVEFKPTYIKYDENGIMREARGTCKRKK